MGVFLIAASLHAAPEAKFKAALRNGIPNRYIVVLESEAAPGNIKRAAAEVRSLQNELQGIYPFETKTRWSHALRGLAIVASEETARRLARDPKVLSVEQDVQISLDEALSAAPPYCSTQCLAYSDPQYTASLPINTRAFPNSPQAISCANPDPGTNTTCIDNWGLDRTDQTLLPRDAIYSFANTGANVHVYVIDMGIFSNHRELTGRIGNGVNVVTGDGNLEDCSCYHHGTAVASVIGGKTYGIAKGAILHPVKVADFCAVPTGQVASLSGYVTALNWIVQNHISPSVANMSGGNDSTFVASTAFSNAVKGLIQNGITFVQSAGNQGNDACGYSMGTHEPTGVPDAIIAGGYTELSVDGPLRNGRWVADYTDPLYGGTQYSYGLCVNRQSGQPPVYCGSNYGSCVSLWAPAQYIVTAGHDNGPTPSGAYCLFTGTSFAAPHVTGAVARYLQNHPTATPQQVKTALVAGAMPNVLQTTGVNSILPATGSPNLLLQIVP
jgi:subtilisin family serine protease